MAFNVSAVVDNVGIGIFGNPTLTCGNSIFMDGNSTVFFGNSILIFGTSTFRIAVFISSMILLVVVVDAVGIELPTAV